MNFLHTPVLSPSLFLLVFFSGIFKSVSLRALHETCHCLSRKKRNPNWRQRHPAGRHGFVVKCRNTGRSRPPCDDIRTTRFHNQFLLLLLLTRSLIFTWWRCCSLCLWHKTNRACPLIFILFLCQFLSLWPFQLYFIPWILSTTLRFLTLFFRFYFCLIGPFTRVSVYESLPQPWYTPLWVDWA